MKTKIPTNSETWKPTPLKPTENFTPCNTAEVGSHSPITPDGWSVNATKREKNSAPLSRPATNTEEGRAYLTRATHANSLPRGNSWRTTKMMSADPTARPSPCSHCDFMRVINEASIEWVSVNIHPHVARSGKDTNASYMRKMALWAMATNTFPANAKSPSVGATE